MTGHKIKQFNATLTFLAYPENKPIIDHGRYLAYFKHSGIFHEVIWQGRFFVSPDGPDIYYEKHISFFADINNLEKDIPL